ncbi:hypothetical protein D3C76_1853780 [compost metagenome]
MGFSVIKRRGNKKKKVGFRPIFGYLLKYMSILDHTQLGVAANSNMTYIEGCDMPSDIGEGMYHEHTNTYY